MTTVAQLLQATPATALPGTWKLPRGRAITLRPTTSGILRIAHGRVWATLDGPHGHRPCDSGDRVLEVGRSLFVHAGQRVVIEAWSRSGAAWFAWDPVLAPVTAPVQRHQQQPQPRVNFAPVLQPLAELRAALAMAGGAFGRLLAGVARIALSATHNGRHGNTCPAR